MTSQFLSRLLTELPAQGDRPLFRHHGHTVSYADSATILRRLHAGLRARGVGKDDVVAIIGGNRPETVLTQFAAQLCGATVLLVAASASVPDRLATVSAAGTTTLVIDPEREPDKARGLVDAGLTERVLTLGPVPAWMPEGTEDLLAAQGEAPLDVPDGVRLLFASGGTTGTPKLIGHSGMYEGVAHIFQVDPDGPKRVLLVAPSSHLTGNAAVLGGLFRGYTVVLHDGFDAGAVLAAIETERVNFLSLTPPRLAALLDHPTLADTDTSSLSELSIGAAPLSPRRLAQAIEAFGPIVGQGYGLTEAPMIATIKAPDFDGHPERLASVGRIVPGMEGRVTGQDDVALPAGEIGEVQVRGLSLMDGYHDPALNRVAYAPGGWLRTGDIGRFDADGYLYLLDRAGDVVVTGEHGTKVYPAQVEGALLGHPSIRQVAVFGVPGADGESEQVAAVVVPAPGAALTPEDVRSHVLEALGGKHFVPSTVEFAGTLPLTGIGKVDKSALRAPFWSGHSRGIA